MLAAPTGGKTARLPNCSTHQPDWKLLKNFVSRNGNSLPGSVISAFDCSHAVQQWLTTNDQPTPETNDGCNRQKDDPSFLVVPFGVSDSSRGAAGFSSPCAVGQRKSAFVLSAFFRAGSLAEMGPLALSRALLPTVYSCDSLLPIVVCWSAPVGLCCVLFLPSLPLLLRCGSWPLLSTCDALVVILLPLFLIATVQAKTKKNSANTHTRSSAR